MSVKTELILNKFSRCLLQREKFIIFKRWILRQQWEHYHFKQNDFFIKEILELYNTYVEKVLIENDLPEGFRPMCKLCLPLVVNRPHWNDEQNVRTSTIHLQWKKIDCLVIRVHFTCFVVLFFGSKLFGLKLKVPATGYLPFLWRSK